MLAESNNGNAGYANPSHVKHSNMSKKWLPESFPASFAKSNFVYFSFLSGQHPINNYTKNCFSGLLEWVYQKYVFIKLNM